MYTINQFVHQNINLCLSPLLSILHTPEAQQQQSELSDCPLRELIGQAAELSYPLSDYEEAARSIGYYRSDSGWVHDTMTPAWCETAEQVCEVHCIEPYQWEVYEYWSVSSCLAHRLQLEGEHVDRDFAGLEVWARTTTGQAIQLDGVIIKIFKDLTTARAGG